MLYTIASRSGRTFGDYEGATPTEALLAMHRDAGYSETAVRLEDGDLAFGEGYEEMLGGVDAWHVCPAEDRAGQAGDDSIEHPAGRLLSDGCRYRAEYMGRGSGYKLYREHRDAFVYCGRIYPADDSECAIVAAAERRVADSED